MGRLHAPLPSVASLSSPGIFVRCYGHGPGAHRNHRRRQHRDAQRARLSRSTSSATSWRCAIRAPRCSSGASGNGTSSAGTPTSTRCSADDDIDAVEILSPDAVARRAHDRRARTRASTCRARSRSPTRSPTPARWSRPPNAAGTMLRVTENCCHYPPLRKARDLIRSGAIGDADRGAHQDGCRSHRVASSRPTSIPPGTRGASTPRVRAVTCSTTSCTSTRWRCGSSTSTSSRAGDRAAGAVVLRSADRRAVRIRTRPDLLGMMEVSYAPDMFIRSDHYGADEFFEIQGTRGFVWVTRLCGNLHVDLAPVVLYEEDRPPHRRSPSSTRRTTARSGARPPRSSTACSPATPPDLDPEHGDRGAPALLRGVSRRRTNGARSTPRRSTPW